MWCHTDLIFKQPPNPRCLAEAQHFHQRTFPLFIPFFFPKSLRDNDFVQTADKGARLPAVSSNKQIPLPTFQL